MDCSRPRQPGSCLLDILTTFNILPSPHLLSERLDVMQVPTATSQTVQSGCFFFTFDFGYPAEQHQVEWFFDTSYLLFVVVFLLWGGGLPHGMHQQKQIGEFVGRFYMEQWSTDTCHLPECGGKRVAALQEPECDNSHNWHNFERAERGTAMLFVCNKLFLSS